ncbi:MULTISPECIES: amino acid synthesis family protein [unclassified Variovorax]|uniref:amino acid synthesis family protein n=1 Tax=unclassified Variovorax TaxID=663243 RepID=UPI0008BBAACB|nr:MULTISPECIES: amino acid synthesis family protein [unclassified Variovorax]SEK17263.1 Amino acid synthesis [Variovorax sp. OK202]SFE76887.1 Amino acid synthesis [Variovorax sp. OK212]
MKMRKIALYVETVHSEGGKALGAQVRRGFAAAVIANPCLADGNLALAVDCGTELGARLTAQLLAALSWQEGTALAYGKAAIVGASGSTEHAAAVLHPRMGTPMRALIGQGKAIIPSTVKRGEPGARIDMPLHKADDEWDFAALDSIEAHVPDAPLPGELVVLVAMAFGGRPGAVIGQT